MGRLTTPPKEPSGRAPKSYGTWPTWGKGRPFAPGSPRHRAAVRRRDHRRRRWSTPRERSGPSAHRVPRCVGSGLGHARFRRGLCPSQQRGRESGLHFFVSTFTGRRLRDTQCGLRRYPVEKTLALRTRDQRFGFEAEVIFAAVRAKIPVVEVPVTVFYPPKHKRVTHYRGERHAAHRLPNHLHHPLSYPLALCPRHSAGDARSTAPAVVHFTEMRPPEVTVSREVAVLDADAPDLRSSVPTTFAIAARCSRSRSRVPPSRLARGKSRSCEARWWPTNLNLAELETACLRRLGAPHLRLGRALRFRNVDLAMTGRTA